MTQLYIPPLRAKFTLLEDWTFPLHHESRNDEFATFMKVVDIDSDGSRTYDDPDTVDVTIPAGTVMNVDRYYIKNGAVEYDSVTFRAWFKKKSQRFWVKLADANRIQAEFQ